MITPFGYSLASILQNQKKITISQPNKDLNKTYSKKRVGEYSYYLNDLIGSGFSSEVFKCHHKQHRDQTLAIKVIKMSKIAKTNYHLLQNEINILQGLDHPNVIKFHNVHYTENNCYLITDYCQGGTLQDLLEINQPIDLEEVLKQLIQGCKYLSQKLIIHRDIKPANVFLKNGIWKIGDFGFARYIQSKQMLIREVYKVGSPLYMPPETLKNCIYSVKTDSFAMGILLFYLITKQYPWPGNNKKQLLELFQIQAFPTAKISHVSLRIQQFVKGLCELNINDRLFITDFKNDQSQQVPLERSQFCLSRFASLQTCSQGSSQPKEEENQSINAIFKQINQLDIVQRIKLCKFVHYIDVNISNIQQLNCLRDKIKRLLKMILVIFGWTKETAYKKYVEQFDCKNYQQFQKMSQVRELQENLQRQINYMKAMEQDKRLRAIRVKFIQLIYILRLVLRNQINPIKQFISRVILHPDFSKIFLFQKQVEEIEKLFQNHH